MLLAENSKTMTLSQLLEIAENNYQSLSSIFEATYDDMYTDDYDPKVSRLLYFDLDTNKFACKDDEQGLFRRAFESQNNVIVIGHIDAETAITGDIESVIELYIQTEW